MERFIHAYEQRSHTRFYHKDANGETSLRRVIELQVRRLARLVLGQTKNYRPFVLK